MVGAPFRNLDPNLAKNIAFKELVAQLLSIHHTAGHGRTP
jgi:hypothetical protein